MTSRSLAALAGAAWIAVVGLGGSAAGSAPALAVGDSVRLAVGGAANSGVAVAAAGQDVVVTWAATSATSTDVYAALSRDGGATFAPPKRVNDVAGDARVSAEQSPRVAIGRGVEVVWISKQEGGGSRVRAATSTDGGRTFGPAKTIHPEGLSGARGWPSLAVAPGGAVHLAWLDGRAARAERVAQEAKGAAGHASMRQDIFQAVWRPEGTHDEVTVATNVCFCCKTAVAAAPDGATYVAWRHIYPTNLRDMAVARSVDGGRTFAAPVRVSEDHWQIDGCPDDGPSMAVDSAGVVHIVWPTVVEGSTSGKAVFYSYSSDGGRSFAPRMRVDDGSGAAGHPQVAVGGNRVAVAFEQSGPRPGAYLREITSGPKATAWTPAMGALSALDASRSATYPALAAGPAAIVTAWTQATETGSEIRVRRLAWAPSRSP